MALRFIYFKTDEPQNIEYRITNVEGWNRFANSLLKLTAYIYSMFDVGCSTFISYLFDQSGLFDASKLSDKELFALLPGLIALVVCLIVGLLLGLLVVIVQITTSYPGDSSDG